MRGNVDLGFVELTEEDMVEIYDYFIGGNVDKDKSYADERIIDMSYEYKDVRLRINISSEDRKTFIYTKINKGKTSSIWITWNTRCSKENGWPATGTNTSYR